MGRGAPHHGLRDPRQSKAANHRGVQHLRDQDSTALTLTEPTPFAFLPLTCSTPSAVLTRLGVGRRAIRTSFRASNRASKELFAQHAYQNAPLVRAICNALATTTDGNLGERFFLDLLRRSFTEQDAQRQLELAIDWGRYAELYEYDASSGQLIREHLVGPVESAAST